MAQALIPVSEVVKRTGLCRASVLRFVERGTFPKPVFPAPRMPRWRADEIESWIERLSNKRDDNAQAAA